MSRIGSGPRLQFERPDFGPPWTAVRHCTVVYSPKHVQQQSPDTVDAIPRHSVTRGFSPRPHIDALPDTQVNALPRRTVDAIPRHSVTRGFSPQPHIDALLRHTDTQAPGGFSLPRHTVAALPDTSGFSPQTHSVYPSDTEVDTLPRHTVDARVYPQTHGGCTPLKRHRTVRWPVSSEIPYCVPVETPYCELGVHLRPTATSENHTHRV